MLPFKYLFKFPLKVFLRFRTYNTRCLHFLEQLHITVCRQAHDFSKTVSICKIKFYWHCPNVFLELLWMVHWFFMTYDTHYPHYCWISNPSNYRSQLWRTQTSLVKFLYFKRTFTVLLNVFLKLFWMVQRFYGLRYNLALFLPKTKQKKL